MSRTGVPAASRSWVRATILSGGSPRRTARGVRCGRDRTRAEPFADPPAAGHREKTTRPTAEVTGAMVRPRRRPCQPLPARRRRALVREAGRLLSYGRVSGRATRGAGRDHAGAQEGEADHGRTISSQALKGLLDGTTTFAFIDVREAGEYNAATSRARARCRDDSSSRDAAGGAVRGTPDRRGDDDGRRARLAADTLERWATRDVSVLAGGMNRWVTDGLDRVGHQRARARTSARRSSCSITCPRSRRDDLAERMASGREVRAPRLAHAGGTPALLHPRRPSVPGGELGLRITELVATSPPARPVIVHCAGRTRSIIGARMLQRMGVENVCGLKNGTVGWLLAGPQLETGADRVELPAPSPEAVAAAEATRAPPSRTACASWTRRARRP